MNINETLQQRLKIWQEHFIPEDHNQGEHLSDEVLYQLATAGSIDHADQEALEHLSLCPICLDKWSNWQIAISITEKKQQHSEDEFISYGMLEAAASAGPVQPLNMPSHCGSFCLGLFPNIENPEAGLLTLEVTGHTTEGYEGRRVTVRDKKGIILIDGPIHEGRIARPYSQLADLDLSSWTIAFNTEED